MLEALVGAVIGAIVGGVATWCASTAQARRERRERDASLRAALAAEILGLVELVVRNHYEDELRQVAVNATAGKEATLEKFFITASHGYFSVFDANAGDIGRLDPLLVVDVVAFYQHARAWLDSLSIGAVPDGNRGTDELAAHYTFLADMTGSLCDLGRDLGYRLAPSEALHRYLHRYIAEAGVLYKGEPPRIIIPRPHTPAG